MAKTYRKFESKKYGGNESMNQNRNKSERVRFDADDYEPISQFQINSAEATENS